MRERVAAALMGAVEPPRPAPAAPVPAPVATPAGDRLMRLPLDVLKDPAGTLKSFFGANKSK